MPVQQHCSCSVLQGLEAADHGINAAAHLLVLIEQRGTFIGEGIVALTQCTILFLQLRDLGGEFIDTGFQAGELEIELRIHWGAHDTDYRHNP